MEKWVEFIYSLGPEYADRAFNALIDISQEYSHYTA